MRRSGKAQRPSAVVWIHATDASETVACRVGDLASRHLQLHFEHGCLHGHHSDMVWTITLPAALGLAVLFVLQGNLACAGQPLAWQLDAFGANSIRVRVSVPGQSGIVEPVTSGLLPQAPVAGGNSSLCWRDVDPQFVSPTLTVGNIRVDIDPTNGMFKVTRVSDRVVVLEQTDLTFGPASSGSRGQSASVVASFTGRRCTQPSLCHRGTARHYVSPILLTHWVPNSITHRGHLRARRTQNGHHPAETVQQGVCGLTVLRAQPRRGCNHSFLHVQQGRPLSTDACVYLNLASILLTVHAVPRARARGTPLCGTFPRLDP